MNKLICALAVALASVAGSAGASTYTFDIQIDLTSDGRVYSTTTNEWWEAWLNVAPTSVVSGDTLNFSIGFVGNKGLMLSDIAGDNTELSKLTLGFTGSTFSDNAFASSHEYIAYSGNLLDTSYAAGTSGAGGNAVPLFHRNDLTDSSFTYWGVNFAVDLGVGDPIGTDSALLTRIEWSSSAQKVAIVDLPSPIPLPASLPLMLAGLAGLGWIGRRKKA